MGLSDQYRLREEETEVGSGKNIRKYYIRGIPARLRIATEAHAIPNAAGM